MGASWRNSWRREDAPPPLSVLARFWVDAAGDEAKEREEDRGSTPGRGGRGPGTILFVPRRGRGELVREEKDEALGRRSG
jgi:hypothetical protein